MPSNNLNRWSGPALAVGGILWLVPWVTDLSQAVQFILTIPALLLIAVGLIGLYRRMSAGSGNGPGLALGAALLGLLLLIASAVGGLAMGVESNTNVPLVLRALFGTGMVLLALGLAGLSVVGFSRNALGSWSFTAPLAALAMLAYVVSIVLAISGAGSNSVVDMFAVVAIVGWMLLGIGLWSSQAAQAEPGLTA